MLSDKQKAQDALNRFADDLIMLGLNDFDDLEPSDVRVLMSRTLDLIFSKSDQKEKTEKRYVIEEFEKRALGSFQTLIDELLEHRVKIIQEARRDNYDEHEERAA